MPDPTGPASRFLEFACVPDSYIRWRDVKLRTMIKRTYRKKLLPLLVMLLALAGMNLSVIGGASSHGVVYLTHGMAIDQHNSAHDYDADLHGAESMSETSPHHDSSNHTHESVDQLTIHLISRNPISSRQPNNLAEDTPRSIHYRLDRPPKNLLIV
jgi:hypothetical protein